MSKGLAGVLSVGLWGEEIRCLLSLKADAGEVEDGAADNGERTGPRMQGPKPEGAGAGEPEAGGTCLSRVLSLATRRRASAGLRRGARWGPWRSLSRVPSGGEWGGTGPRALQLWGGVCSPPAARGPQRAAWGWEGTMADL